MSFDTTPEAGGTPLQQPYVVLSGEGVGALSAEAVEELRLHAVELAGGLSVEAMAVADLGSVDVAQAEQALEPIPATRAQMLAFAVEHGYPRQRAAVSWLCVIFTHARQETAAENSPYDPATYPIRYIGDAKHEKAILDLRSVYERLAGTRLNVDSWRRGTPDKVKFLAHFVNEVMQPEEPLGHGGSKSNSGGGKF